MSSHYTSKPGSTSRHARQVSLTSTISVYSTTAPSMSRASSEQIVQILDTPMDECFSSSVSSCPKTLGRGDDAYDDTRPRPAIQTDVFYDRLTGDPSVAEGPILRYTTLPPSLTSPLEYRRSTRELISRYEAISSPARTPPSKHSADRPPLAPPVPPSLRRRNSPLPELPATAKLKHQTPFSFRSLLTVFGRKNKSPRPEACVSVPKAVNLQAEDVFLTSSLPRSGPALYLSSSIRPALWRSCNLTLHPSHLALTFFEDARHITHTIPLLYCVDVVSLASHQLGQIPAPPLGRENELNKVAYVFEMTFEGYEPAKERLATWSVAERGRWVSATWDAILACRDPKTARSDVRVASPNDIIRGPPLKVVNGTSQPSSSASSPSLAAQPTGQDKARSPSPVSSINVPATPTRPRRLPLSEPSSMPPCLPSSSSIQTLGSMSIVRSRLAKLDAQEHSPCVHAFSRDTLGMSGSYVASSMMRQAPRSNKEDQTVHAYMPKSVDHFEREGIASLNSIDAVASQDTSFTALDAHAMYHEPPHDLMAKETIIGRTKRIRDEESSTLKTTMEPRPQDSVEIIKQDVHSLVKAFHDHEAEQSSQASNLAGRLTSIDGGIDTLVTNLKQYSIDLDLAPIHQKLNQIQNDLAPFDAGSVRKFFDGMESTSDTYSVDTLADIPHPNGLLNSRIDLSPVLTKLDELQNSLKEDLPLILQKFVGFEATSTNSIDMATILATLEGLKDVVTTRRAALEASYTPADFEEGCLEDIMAKLDGLITFLMDTSKASTKPTVEEFVMHNASPIKHVKGMTGEPPEELMVTEGTNTAPSHRGPAADSEQITKLLELLQDDQTNRATQAQQQADSVRYLNELNTWLEAFVTSSVGNMRQVATGVDQLRKEWLPVSEAPTDADCSDSNENDGKEVVGPDNTFASLQRFLTEQQGKGEETQALHAAIQTLTEAVKEDMAQNAEVRFEMVRHAQVQETLLNGLATELTKEIRGERLRFVDAMKDATSVNVAVHVEEFKKVLGRLHHEKMVLEQQIAELFSFVAKQKQGHPAQAQPQPRPIRTSLEVPRAPPRPLPQVHSHKPPPGHIGDGTAS